MSAELELRWLKIKNTKGAAKLFAEFCKEDVRKQSKLGGFDISKYQDAVKLVMRKLDNSHSVKGLFTPEPEKAPKEGVINAD